MYHVCEPILSRSSPVGVTYMCEQFINDSVVRIELDYPGA